jgi:hypothetical protein
VEIWEATQDGELAVFWMRHQVGDMEAVARDRLLRKEGYGVRHGDGTTKFLNNRTREGAIKIYLFRQWLIFGNWAFTVLSPCNPVSANS